MNKQIKQCEMATYYIIPIIWHSGKCDLKRDEGIEKDKQYRIF